MRARQPALPGAFKTIGAIAAGPFLVAALCLAGALAAFLVYPAYAQSSDEASAPSNLTAAIADGGVILNWSSPVQDAASVTGYEILRRRPKEGEGALLVLAADTGSTATTYTDATANEPGVRYVYRVKALRGSEKSSRSNYVRVDLPEEGDETGPTPAPGPRGVAVQPSDAQAETCPGGDFNQTPTAVEVTAVPIVVTSTTAEYFVLYVSHDVDGTEVELPVLVKRGEARTTTLAENVEALPAERYRVEKYLIADPADVDGDCVDDITELGDPVGMSPVNSAPPLSFSDGAVSMPDLETYVEMSQLGDTEAHSKIVVLDPGSERPGLVFINAKTHETHQRFLDAMGIDRPSLSGFLTYNSQLVAPGGSRGAWYVWVSSHITFATTERIYSLMAANMPALRDDLYIYVPAYKEDEFEHEREQYEASRVDVVFWEDLSPRTRVDLLNPGVGFGRLRVMDPDDRPHPREVVIYATVPNELPRVAGVITTVRQTPLSHVNLRAAQDGVPNAYVRDLLKDTDVAALVGGFVRYEVTATEWSLRAATPREVDEHYESSRPPQAQTPQRDLSVRSIAPLSDVRFEDWDAFGVKAANVAELGRLGFPEGTVPDGFAIPFYFYDEFMKANGFHDRIEQILADPDFQSDFDVQDDMLDDLRDDIEDAESPQWIIDALTEMHESFPEGTSLRYRSSTNNEDLPGFNGAGLYDSKTQDPEETEEDGIDKSLKGVFASLWNFRAFTERDFHRIGHGAAAMGVLVHPNYSDELANGVAVSFDPFYDGPGRYYVNTQLGEDLVTNPLPHSVPEELLLLPDGNYLVRSTSNLVGRGELLMSDAQIGHLAQHLTTIHDHFEALYNPSPGEPFAMEIEFKITSDDVLAIKQARPWVFSGAATPSPDRAGTVTLPSTQLQVGAALTAALADPDGSISNLAWQWASSPNGSSNWAPISGAASARYMPVDGDVGKYLRATASYTDGHGAGKSAQAVSANPVEDAPPPPPPPPPPPRTGGGGGGGGAPANRAPEFMEGDRTTRSIAENTPAGVNIGDPVAASDFNRDTLTYSLRGLGSDLFDVDASSGQLLTKAILDYETEASYIVFVWVQDNKNAIGRPDTERDTVIRIELAVTNEDEAGAVALSLSEPDVDVLLTAALIDPDGGLDRVVWSWARSADQTAWTAIRGAALASYTPVAADKGSYLRGTASYTDGHGPRKSAQAATAAPVPSNAAPAFPDVPGGTIERSVAENTGEGEAVGAPVAATDAEGGAVTYALGGADAALFTIDEGTGQIRVGAGTALDHEADRNVYTVDVTATDSLGVSTTVTVTIAVTNVGLGSPLADAYDADGDEAVDRDEILAAVADYFAGAITKEEAVAVIRLYFAS